MDIELVKGYVYQYQEKHKNDRLLPFFRWCYKRGCNHNQSNLASILVGIFAVSVVIGPVMFIGAIINKMLTLTILGAVLIVISAVSFAGCKFYEKGMLDRR